MKRSTRDRIGFLVILVLMAVGIVYAQVIGPTGVYDFPWVNGTRVNTAHFYINGTDYTNAIIFGGAAHDQNLNTTAAVTFVTVNTGLGANELYDMDQNVLSTSSVTFGNVNSTDSYVLGSQLDIVATINVNLEWSGEAVEIQAGENLDACDLLYIDGNGHVLKADADSDTTVPVVCMALEDINNGQKGLVLTQGWVYNSTWTLAEGDYIFLSTGVGALSNSAPVGAGDQVQVIGIGLTEDLLYFNPDYTVMEIT